MKRSARCEKGLKMTRLLATGAVLSLVACGNGAPPSELSTAVKVLSAEVVNGDTANDYSLSWTTEPAGAPVAISWSFDPSFAAGARTTLSLDANASELDWSATGTPQRRYFQIAPENGAAVIVATRLLPLEGGRNFRDLGGYETEDGRTVKWGHVFRSGRMRVCFCISCKAAPNVEKPRASSMGNIFNSTAAVA